MAASSEEGWASQSWQTSHTIIYEGQRNTCQATPGSAICALLGKLAAESGAYLRPIWDGGTCDLLSGRAALSSLLTSLGSGRIGLFGGNFGSCVGVLGLSVIETLPFSSPTRPRFCGSCPTSSRSWAGLALAADLAARF